MKHNTQAPAPTRAAIYLRVSTEDQASSGYGLDVQLARCQAQAVVKGWLVDGAHVFADEGISGTKDAAGRPALAGLLAAVDAGEVDAVIVLALDRLGRKLKIVLDLVERITSAGCEVVSCKESLDTSTPAGLFVVHMFAALAQLDHSNTVKRLADGRNARYMVDGERGGPIPFGYIRTSEGIGIDHQAGELVRVVFERRQAGATMRAIAEQMSKHSPGPRGKGWHASSVKRILDHEQTYRGRRGLAPWPAILD